MTAYAKCSPRTLANEGCSSLGVELACVVPFSVTCRHVQRNTLIMPYRCCVEGDLMVEAEGIIQMLPSV